MYTLDWVKVKSAIVSAVITAVLAVAGYIIGVGDVFNIDVHALVNVASLSTLTAFVSLIKAFFTTDRGNFAGAVRVK